MFLFDTSGSMSPALSEAKAEITSTMQDLSSALPDTAFGVAQVEDYPGYEEGQLTQTFSEAELEAGTEKPWRLDQPISSEEARARTAVEGLSTYAGGDAPEAYGRALWETDTNPTVAWRPGARHVIVLVADQVPHTPNVNEGIPEQFWLENPFDTFQEQPGRWGIPGTVWTPGTDTEFPADLSRLATDGKPLAMVDYHDTEGDYIHYWESWAARTGGAAIEAEEGGNELASKLTTVIKEAAAHELVGCASGYFRAGEEACQPRHATSTAISCALQDASAADTCTAQVSDTSGAGATPPGGAVTFGTSAGSFPNGSTCTLAALTATSSSCSVTLVPPSTAYQAITEIKRLPPVLEHLAGELEGVISSQRAAESAVNRGGSFAGSVIAQLESLERLLTHDAASVEALAEQARQVLGESSPAALAQLISLEVRLSGVYAQLSAATADLAWTGSDANTFRNAVSQLAPVVDRAVAELQVAGQAHVLASYGGDTSHAPSANQSGFPPASGLASSVHVSSTGTFTSASVSIPVGCQFACDLSGELESSQSSATASSLAPVAMASTKKLREGKQKRRHPRKRKRPVAYGSGHLKLLAGGKGTLVIRLSPKGRALLAHARRAVRLTLAITITSPFGTIVSEELRTVTLHPARKRAPHRHRKR